MKLFPNKNENKLYYNFDLQKDVFVVCVVGV